MKDCPDCGEPLVGAGFDILPDVGTVDAFECENCGMCFYYCAVCETEIMRFPASANRSDRNGWGY